MSTQTPLTPEERALADALQRLGPPSQPSAALDARILAMAREGAVSASVANAHASVAPRVRRRWPMALGIAASMVLAVGIAWRMLPIAQHDPYAADEAAMSASAPEMQSTAAVASMPADMAAADAVDESANTAVAPAAMRTVEIAREPIAAESQEAEPARAPQAFPPPTARVREASDAASSEVAESEPAAPAPPPSAITPAPIQGETAVAIGTRSTTAEPAKSKPVLDSANTSGQPAPLPAESAAVADLPAAPTATSETKREAAAEEDLSGFTVDEINRQPPTNADAPLVQKAWLQRIRQLVAEGHIEAASASLKEFQRRYPQYSLPPDLQHLQMHTPQP